MPPSPGHCPDKPVLAIDPGTAKCGLALVSGEGRPLGLCVVPLEELEARIRELTRALCPAVVLIGDRTGSRHVQQVVARILPGAEVALVPEHLSSLRARERYFRDHPPRGWRRLLPKGLRVPPVPHDDYVALVLAEDYLGR
ncbi:MAG: pre-16S rRNA-processing nuclease YqgF, partial [Armatimonadota bacterium]